MASATLGQIRPVLSTFGRRLRAAVPSVANHVKTALREAARPLPRVAGFAMDLTRSSRELLAENTLLLKQLIVASRKVKRPVFRPHERGLLVLLVRLARRPWCSPRTAISIQTRLGREPNASSLLQRGIRTEHANRGQGCARGVGQTVQTCRLSSSPERPSDRRACRQLGHNS